MSRNLPVKSPAAQEEEPKLSVIELNANEVSAATRIIRFRNRPMVLRQGKFPHYVPLRREEFDTLAYPLLGGISRSRMGDVFSFVSNTAEDLTDNDRYIVFGNPVIGDDGSTPEHPTVVWDMRRLEIVTLEQVPLHQVIWRCPYTVRRVEAPIPFVMSLAGGDQDVYDDIMQSLAPLIMEKKPDGVIWWVGDGANGKSTLMDAIYRLFPGQLSSLTVKRLTDGRDTPSLNGTLANVVKESSEGRVDDTEIYKAIGTHEDFRVHKFHSQDDIVVRGNMHHIFSANMIPTFNDKGHSARRRTFVVPFKQQFASDPTFEQRTFTDELFGQLIMEMMKYASRLVTQRYKYKWSATTLAAKADYDIDANNAEEYAKSIISEGVVGFQSFHPVRIDYENWCADNGYVPLGITNLRRALKACGFDRMSLKDPTTGNVGKYYRLSHIEGVDLAPFSIGRPGLFTTPGFMPDVPDPEPLVQEAIDTVTTTTTEAPSILKGKW